MELGPLSIKKWDAGEKNGEIGQFLAELVFWLSCKISFFTISNHTNGAADYILFWKSFVPLEMCEDHDTFHGKKLFFNIYSW